MLHHLPFNCCNTTTIVLWPFVRDCLRETVPDLKHSPTHHPDHHPIFISFFHLLRSIPSSLFKVRAGQSLCTTSLHVLFGLPLGLEPSTSYSIHLFTQSVSSFRNTCPYHHNLFCCSINIISSIHDWTVSSEHLRFMFLVSSLFFFVRFPCGRLSWLHVSFWAHVNTVHHIICHIIFLVFL